TALHHNRSDLGSLFCLAELGCKNHHTSKRGRQWQRPQPPSHGRDSASRVERFQLHQLLARGVDGGGRRRINPRQQERIGCSPFRACEQQGCEIGRANLGLGESGKALRLWLMPQAKADAGLSTASATPPLIGGGTRRTHSL